MRDEATEAREVCEHPRRPWGTETRELQAAAASTFRSTKAARLLRRRRDTRDTRRLSRSGCSRAFTAVVLAMRACRFSSRGPNAWQRDNANVA